MLDMTIAIPSSVLTIYAAQSKYGALHACQAACPSRRSLPATITTKAHEAESVEHQDTSQMAHASLSRRSVSCFELSAAKKLYRPIRIGNNSEELHQLAHANVSELVKTASSSAEAGSNNALLARKALRYRKIWTQEDVKYTSSSC